MLEVGLLTLSPRPYSHGSTDYCGRRRAARGGRGPCLGVPSETVVSRSGGMAGGMEGAGRGEVCSVGGGGGGG